MYPEAFEHLIHSLRNIPGVGQKSAERYAFDLLEFTPEEMESFIQSLQQASTNLRKCNVCGNLSEGDLCEVCKDESRQNNVVCVVQSPKDVIAMEKIKEYHGLYHVLNGVINTSKGVMPQDINLESLLQRIDEKVEEVILATNPTIEGETTALYIAKLLEKKKVNVTRIAHGLPMGGHLDYADELTLLKAMEGRNKM